MMNRKRRSRRGFTLVEILASVAIISILGLMAAGVSARVLAFYELRGGAEQFLWALRRAQAETISRGHVQTVPPPGVFLWTQRFNDTRDGFDTFPGGYGFCFVVYGGSTNLPKPADNPGAYLTANPAAAHFIVNLPRGVQVRRDDGSPAGAALTPAQRDWTFRYTGELASGETQLLVTDPAVQLPYRIQFPGTAAQGRKQPVLLRS